MMMLWHITIWFMALVQFFFNFIFKGTPKTRELQSILGHFIDLRYFIVLNQRWPCGQLKERSRLGLLCICVGSSSCSSSSLPVRQLAIWRDHGQLASAKQLPAILPSCDPECQPASQPALSSPWMSFGSQQLQAAIFDRIQYEGCSETQIVAEN